MAGQVAQKVARFELRYTVPENTVMNVFHARSTASSWAEATLDAVEAEFLSWFTGSASLLLSDQLALYEIVATDLTSLAGIRKVYPIQPPVDGNSNAEYLPANVTFAVKANIGTRGKGQSGRVFWPALVDTQVTNQEMQKSAADDIVTSLNALRTGIAGVTGCDGLCVPHFVVGGSRPPLATNSLILSYSYSDLVLDSQRDRLPAHKKHKR